MRNASLMMRFQEISRSVSYTWMFILFAAIIPRVPGMRYANIKLNSVTLSALMMADMGGYTRLPRWEAASAE